MNRERLEMLIDLLRDVERRQLPFAMDKWLGRSERIQTAGSNPAPYACGTAACALGYAALDPRFRDLGLRLEYADTGTTGVVTSIEQFNALTPSISFMVFPVYAGDSGFEAGERFFDVDDEASSYMFDPGYYVGNTEITPSDVITHIEEVIAANGIMYYAEEDEEE